MIVKENLYMLNQNRNVLFYQSKNAPYERDKNATNYTAGTEKRSDDFKS
jgi:hypothetical protein